MWRMLGWAMAALAAGAVALALVVRWRDRAADARVWAALEAARDPAPPRFDTAEAEGLPEIAQRYIARTFAPGAPLHRVVGLEMAGDFVLGGRSLPMTARQILAPPAVGFVWAAEVGSGPMRMSGSDGFLSGSDGTASWTRFGLFGLIPLVRAGGTADHARSAGGRAMLESIWAPAVLLPRYGAVWAQTGPDTAELRRRDLPDLPPVHLTLTAEGDPAEIWALRWSDANPERVWRWQPFGGRVLETAVFDGVRLPVRVEMGHFWGTQDFAPFFRATVTAARF